MKGTICIFSIGKLTNLFKTEVKNVNALANYIIHEAMLDKVLHIAQTLQQIDVIVTSDTTATFLKQKIDKPIITIQPDGFDILSAIMQASKHDSTVTIFSYIDNIKHKLNILKDLLNINLNQITYSNFEDLCIGMSDCAKQGVRYIVGGPIPCEISKKYNIEGILYYSNETIRQAISVSVELAHSISKEKQESNQLKALIDYSYEGILVTDINGNITLCNPKAEKTLGISSDYLIRKNIDIIMPKSDVDSIINLNKPELSQTCSINNRDLLINKIPVYIENDRISNVLITFHDFNSIRKAEQKIRKNLLSKGFVAKYNFNMLKSLNRSFNKTLEKAKLFSKSHDHIVITGESGTGKELIAQAIHNYSSRHKNAFVAVNCAALPESLLESELFGYEEGAFTGARKGGKVGLFEMAHEGTIFLDEIGEIQNLQSILLRTIQEKEIMHVGGNRLIPIDSRIIASTNKDLWKMVSKGTFREDLYYRLNVLELYLPPLRERKDDTFFLFSNIIQKHCMFLADTIQNYQSRIEPLLNSHDWPGNIRELENCAKNIISMTNKPQNIGEITLLLSEYIEKAKQKNSNYEDEDKPTENLYEFDKCLKKVLISKEIPEALIKTKGNRTEAAKLLGISRSTLWRKLRKYNI